MEIFLTIYMEPLHHVERVTRIHLRSLPGPKCIPQRSSISNNSGFRLKHPGVPDGSDGSGGTSYPLTENQTRPVAQATGRVAYLPCGGNDIMPRILATCRVVYYAPRSGVRLPLICVRNVVTYTHHQNDTYVTLFAGVAVMQWPFTPRLAMFMPFFGR